jgi:hypothetical protein
MPLNDDAVFEIARHYRFQWEPAQQAHVLLYPEGMVKLPGSSGEIMKRVNGRVDRWRNRRGPGTRISRCRPARRRYRVSGAR